MSDPKTSEDSTSVISSLESQDGRSPSGSLAFQTTLDYGQVVVPVRHFHKQARSGIAQLARAVCLSRALEELASSYALTAITLGLPTPDTSGLSSGGSSRSAALGLSLENRLRARMDLYGSPEYALRWKYSAMVLGLPICQLAALGRRKSARGCSGWPTATTRDYKEGTETSCENVPVNALLGRVVHVAGWSTPKTPSGGGQEARGIPGGGLRKLEDHAMLAGWAAPSATGSTGECSQDLKRRGEKWVNRETGRILQTNLATDALMLIGNPSGGNAGTTPCDVSQWRLSPFFSAWLMGFPAIWSVIGLRAVFHLGRKSKAAPRSSMVTETP